MGRNDGMTLRHWSAVIGAGLLMAVAILMFLSASLMLPPLAESLGVGLGQVMAFSSINFLVQAAVMSTLGSSLTRRFGTRRLIIAGGAFSGAMVYAVSFVTSLTGLYALALAAGVMFAVATQLSATVVVNEWFHARRAFMMGVMMAIGGLGGIAAGSVLPQVVAAGGWQLGFQVAGAVIVAITALCGVFLIRSTPAEVGLVPFGASPDHGHAGPAEAPVGMSAAAAVHTPQFAALVVGLLGLNTILAIQQHIAPLMGERGLDTAAAGSLISILSIVNIGATLLVGVLIDRYGPLRTYLAATGLLIAALAVFGVSYGYLPQLGGVLLFSLGAVIPPVLTPVAFRRIFGARAFAALLGVGLATMPVGIAIGSPLWGLAKDLTGSYQLALVAAMGIAALSAALVGYAMATPVRSANASSNRSWKAGSPAAAAARIDR